MNNVEDKQKHNLEIFLQHSFLFCFYLNIVKKIKTYMLQEKIYIKSRSSLVEQKRPEQDKRYGRISYISPKGLAIASMMRGMIMTQAMEMKILGLNISLIL